MAYWYVDSSVLVRRHALEIGTAWVQALADPAANNSIITSHISTVEVVSAFQRKQREGEITAVQSAQLTTDFLAVCTNEYELVDVTASVLAQARDLVQRYPLKAGDAVQFASALLVTVALREAGLGTMTFLAADRQLLRAAQAEELFVDDPGLHP